jgi:hypothetical protein
VLDLSKFKVDAEIISVVRDMDITHVFQACTSKRVLAILGFGFVCGSNELGLPILPLRPGALTFIIS